MSSRKVNGQETVNMETVIDTGADVLIDLLIHRWGVRHVLEYPGDRINGVIEALRRQGDRCSARAGVIGRKSYLLEANFPLNPDVIQKLPRRQQFMFPKEGPDA